MAIEVGKTKFRYAIYDANPEWLVKKHRGSGCYDCVIVDCPDYSGTSKVFSTEEIEKYIAYDARMQELFKETDSFYDNLTLGDIYHYDDGFGNFIRCEVVAGEGNKKVLMPIALVGAWRSHDLPQRRQAGDIYFPCACANVLTGRTFTPNDGSIYESKTYRRSGSNPRNLKPIEFKIREMTRDEAIKAFHWNQVHHIDNLISARQQNTDPLLLLKLFEETAKEAFEIAEVSHHENWTTPAFTQFKQSCSWDEQVKRLKEKEDDRARVKC